MSEKPKRTLVEIQQDYANTAAKYGNLHYQISMLKKDVALLEGLLQDLNLEGAAAQAATTEGTKA